MDKISKQRTVADTIKIGIIDKFHSHAVASDLQEYLAQQGLNIEIIILNSRTHGSFTQIEDSLRNGELETFIIPLTDVPIIKSENFVIAALSDKESPGLCLILKNSTVDTTLDLRIRIGSHILASSQLAKEQLLNIRHDIQVTIQKYNVDEAIQLLINNHYEGVLLPKSDIKNLFYVHESFEIIDLNPKEIIPPAGSGVSAVLVHPENLILRKWCQGFHNKETAMVTNVERKIQQLSGDIECHVYVYQDKKSFFHVIACCKKDTLKIVRLSQSTSAELAENVYSKMV